MRTARVTLWVVPFALVLGLAAEACGQERAIQPRHVPGPPDRQLGMVEHWTERLANELEHLYEDLYYDRAGGGLLRDAERALEAVMHFQQVLRRGADREHLLRDFRDMDRELHQLLDRLAGSRAPWIRRSGARVQYADEQLHYYLRIQNRRDDEAFRELVARHAHILEQEARQLEQFARRLGPQRQGNAVYNAIATFAGEAEHFHEIVERGADPAHIREDFEGMDRAWHEAVDRINRSPVGIWLRRSAQRVNTVHNQLHAVLGDVPGEPPPPRDHRHRERPRIEFEIPGIGRFQLGD